jgi:ABC-type transport system involved in multi-copper enzyme maturation permease subunit
MEIVSLPWMSLLPLAAVLTIAGTGLMALALLGWRLAARCCGPVFMYDLARTARQGSLFWHRCLYACILLALLFYHLQILHPQSGLFETSALNAPKVPEFAHSIFVTLLGVQFTGILFLTPLYAAGPLADERQRGTLDLLRTTALTDREIVIGLTAARLANLFLLALAALPVLALLFVLGGIDAIQLVLAAIAAGVFAVNLGALSAFESARAPSPLRAIGLTFGMALGFLLATGLIPCLWWLNPIFAFYLIVDRVALSGADFMQVLFCLCLGGQVVMALALIVSAIRTLGTERTSSRPVPTSKPSIVMKDQAHRLSTSQAKELSDALKTRSIGDRPLWWKESSIEWRWLRRESQETHIVGIGMIIVLVGVVVPLVTTQLSTKALGVLLTSLAAIGAAVRVAPRLIRERERRTLDLLLVLPISNHALLGAKWLAGVLPMAALAVLAAFAWITSALAGDLDVTAPLLLVFASASYIVFAGTVGLWLSAVCSTTLRAMLLAGLVMAAVILGPAAFMPDIPRYDIDAEARLVPQPTPVQHFLYYGLSPRAALEALMVRSARYSILSAPGTWPTLVGAMSFTGAAMVLWLDAHRRLRKD